MSMQYSVSYERKLSDQNYGSEGISASWSWSLDDSAIAPGAAIEWLRSVVLGELARSAAEPVRRVAERELKRPEAAVRVPIAVAHPDGTEGLEDLPF